MVSGGDTTEMSDATFYELQGKLDLGLLYTSVSLHSGFGASRILIIGDCGINLSPFTIFGRMVSSPQDVGKVSIYSIGIKDKLY